MCRGEVVLENLFRLDGAPTVIGQNGIVPSMSPGDTVANAVFDLRQWKPPAHWRGKKVTFRNVAFPKIVARATFTDCVFEDCLFIGTRFREVEFHGSKFNNCNFWKSRFHQVYLDPDSIKLDDRFKVEAPNVGISVFQALLANFAEERQDEFYMRADVNFRRWKRYQIPSDIRRKRIGWKSGNAKILKSIVYEYTAGFGYKPLNFFATTLILFFSVSVINYYYIGSDVKIDGNLTNGASFVDALFYTFSILTVLGFSSIVPATDCAKVLAVFEALVSIGWLGIFSSVLVKRLLR
mgnify:CR=1 FL=1